MSMLWARVYSCPWNWSILPLFRPFVNVFTVSQSVYNSTPSSWYTAIPVHVHRQGNKRCVGFVSRPCPLNRRLPLCPSRLGCRDQRQRPRNTRCQRGHRRRADVSFRMIAKCWAWCLRCLNLRITTRISPLFPSHCQRNLSPAQEELTNKGCTRQRELKATLKKAHHTLTSYSVMSIGRSNVLKCCISRRLVQLRQDRLKTAARAQQMSKYYRSGLYRPRGPRSSSGHPPAEETPRPPASHLPLHRHSYTVPQACTQRQLCGGAPRL